MFITFLLNKCYNFRKKNALSWNGRLFLKAEIQNLLKQHLILTSEAFCTKGLCSGKYLGLTVSFENLRNFDCFRLYEIKIHKKFQKVFFILNRYWSEVQLVILCIDRLTHSFGSKGKNFYVHLNWFRKKQKNSVYHFVTGSLNPNFWHATKG